MVRHSSRIFLSQSALRNNVNFLRKIIGPHPIYSAVIKANAYGHGIEQMVRMLEKCGVDHFSVASAHEAEEVLEACSGDSRIMIMGILYKDDIGWAIKNDIEFFVFDYARLRVVKDVAMQLGKPALIHLELETGTNRTGINREDFARSVTFLKRNAKYVKFQGLCTHLGGAESRGNDFKIRPQMERFFDALKYLKKKKFMPKYRHMACSASALAYPETRLDLVRFGVATYGFWPSPDIYYNYIENNRGRKTGTLKRVLTWKSDIMDIKPVHAGDFIGYGTAYQAKKNMKVAVIPLGYSNGYPRGMSNRGSVLIGGKKAPILGLINMNLFMVDVSHIPDVEIGDEVVLLGKQKNSVIKVSSFTEYTNLLNNEMLSRLPAAIPRKIVR
jgi:alanine racemase